MTEIRYCQTCGRKIADHEIESGTAVQVGNLLWCERHVPPEIVDLLNGSPDRRRRTPGASGRMPGRVRVNRDGSDPDAPRGRVSDRRSRATSAHPAGSMNAAMVLVMFAALVLLGGAVWLVVHTTGPNAGGNGVADDAGNAESSAAVSSARDMLRRSKETLAEALRHPETADTFDARMGLAESWWQRLMQMRNDSGLSSIAAEIDEAAGPWGDELARLVATRVGEDAQRLIGLGDHAAAVELVQAVVDGRSELLPVSLCRPGVGGYDQLRAWLNKVHRIASAWDGVALRVRAADKLREAKDYEKAAAAYTGVIDELPDHFVALAGRALCHANLRRLDDARKDVERALAASRGLPLAWHAKGWIAFLAADYRASLEAFDEAIRLSPTPNVRFHCFRGAAWNALGNPTKALADYDLAEEIDSQFPMLWFGRGLVYKTMRDGNRAFLSFQRATELDPDFYEAHYEVAQQYKTRNGLLAIRHFQECMRLRPNDWRAYWEIAAMGEKSLQNPQMGVNPNDVLNLAKIGLRYCPPGPDRDRIQALIDRVTAAHGGGD